MMKLTIKRPECFSKAQVTVLEIFQDSSSVDSLYNKLKGMRFINTGFDVEKSGLEIRLVPQFGEDTNIAATYEEAV